MRAYVTGAGIAVHTNPCERLSVRVAVARVALRQCLLLRRVRVTSVTTLRRVRLSLSVTAYGSHRDNVYLVSGVLCVTDSNGVNGLTLRNRREDRPG